MSEVQLEIKLPTYITIPRKTKKDKKLAINMNIYRNLHFIVENQSKKIFKEIVRHKLENVKLDIPLDINYKIFVGTKRECDIDNIGSILSKYFHDALTELGCIPDDNYNFIKKVSYEFGGYEKNNAHAMAYIKKYKDVNKKDEVIQDELF